MELTLQSIKSGVFIKNYENHSLYIDDKIYSNNVLVTSAAVENWDLNDNAYRYILIIFSLIVILFFRFVGIPIAIIGYLVLSLISSKKLNV